MPSHNPPTDREVNMIFFCVCVILVLLYFAGVGIAYGISIAASPNNNITTGCPNGQPDCPPNLKMMCYKNNMGSCFAIAIPLMLAEFIGLAIIMTVCILCCMLIFGESISVTDQIPATVTESTSVSLDADNTKSESVVDIDESDHISVPSTSSESI